MPSSDARLQPYAAQPVSGLQLPSRLPLVLALVGLVAVIVLIVFAVRSCTTDHSGESAGGSGAAGASAAASYDEARVSFVAVGDNVPNDEIADFADMQKGESGDGQYDYRALFAPVKRYIEAADLAYIDQEVHVGGDEIGPKGYPSFNTTDEMADAVVDAGFDLVASATNHSYDWGTYKAIEHSRSVWNALPVAFTGTATSDSEAENIPVVERNGMKFALLSYTYGLNGYEKGDIPDYYVNLYDEARLTKDVGRARESADVVIVAMHWGQEYESEPTDEEKRYAQLLADLGADVVVGSHPHIIQPMTWLQGKNGNSTLVCYSLGNFIMNYDRPAPSQTLEGMMSCDFVRSSDGSIAIENVKWTPLVYHAQVGRYSVFALKDYPPLLAHLNPSYDDTDKPCQWMREESARIVNSLGDSFEIDD